MKMGGNEAIRDSIASASDPNVTTMIRRRMSAVVILYRRGALRARHVLAADHLYRSYMVGERGAIERQDEQNPDVRLAPWEKAEMSERRMIALGEYKRAVKALGRTMAEFVIPAVVLDLGVEEMRALVSMDRRKAIGYLEAGLDVLADHYGIAVDAILGPESAPDEEAA